MEVPSIRLTLVGSIVRKTNFLCDAALVVGFACLTAICAQISFWIGIVPITGQTFAVLLSGALLGSRRGALSQLSYLTIGATGVPYWFALGGPPGITRLTGPTGGYLIGFVAAAFIVGWLTERGWGRHVVTSIVSMFIGSITYYIFGMSWLIHFVSEGTVLQAGLYPFVIGDLVKIMLASLTLLLGWQLYQRFVS